MSEDPKDIIVYRAEAGCSIEDAYRHFYPELKERIYRYVMDMDHCSFVEVEKLAGPEHAGNQCMHHGDQHTIVWVGMSAELADVVIELLNDKKVELMPCLSFVGGMPLVYITDGKLLSLPLVKRKLLGYKEDHWLPCTLSRPGSMVKQIAEMEKKEKKKAKKEK
jgi:hypothetical protein